jgi:hypothetical protein
MLPQLLAQLALFQVREGPAMTRSTNFNSFKKNATFPQVAVALSLLVSVAFLSAFLVSPLAFSTLNQHAHPAVGSCPREL